MNFKVMTPKLKTKKKPFNPDAYAKQKRIDEQYEHHKTRNGGKSDFTKGDSCHSVYDKVGNKQEIPMQLKSANDFLAWIHSSKTIALKLIYVDITGDMTTFIKCVTWHRQLTKGIIDENLFELVKQIDN